MENYDESYLDSLVGDEGAVDYPEYNDASPPDFPTQKASNAPRKDSKEGYISKKSKQALGMGLSSKLLEERVLFTAQQCIAATHGRATSDLLDIVGYIQASEIALTWLDTFQRKTFARLVNILQSAFGDDTFATVDLYDIPDMEVASKQVQGMLSSILEMIGSPSLPVNPPGHWRALVNDIQRRTARFQASKLIEAIDADEPDDEVMGIFRGFNPPVSTPSAVNSTFSQSAADWENADREAAAMSAPYRLSSGYPTVDYALTARLPSGEFAEPLGSFAPGELWVFAAPTGNGKSATSRILATSFAQDMQNLGREFDKVVFCITEETPTIVYQHAKVASGMNYHHLAKNLIIANCGSSRKRIVHSVWDQVIEAYHRSKELGIPITAAGLPTAIIWDYIGGTVEAGEDGDKTAMERNANLALRGLSLWDVDAMEAFSGENFAAYAGMPWPKGMEHFRPLVLAFAQFVKLKDPIRFDATSSKCNRSDFVSEDISGNEGWPLEDGDFRLPTQAEVRGSGVLINHATGLVIMHRSKPQMNPPTVDEATGEVHLKDTRARWLLVKTRNGASMPFIPMAFDSTPSGKRGQFYDALAEQAIKRGVLNPTQPWHERGDPILPPRNTKSAFSGVSY